MSRPTDYLIYPYNLMDGRPPPPPQCGDIPLGPASPMGPQIAESSISATQAPRDLGTVSSDTFRLSERAWSAPVSLPPSVTYRDAAERRKKSLYSSDGRTDSLNQN